MSLLRAQVKIEHGWVIGRDSVGYYESNDLGDWSLTGTESSAHIFTDKEDAEAVLEDVIKNSNYEIQEVTRMTAFYPMPLTDKQRDKIREFLR